LSWSILQKSAVRRSVVVTVGGKAGAAPGVGMKLTVG
jgi:hypothetical protein